MKMTDRLNGYLNILLIIGIVGIISGVFFTYILFDSNVLEAMTIYYFPIKALGIFWVYKLINDIGPGGNVNFYFGANHKPNEDERLLNRMIAKYKSTLFVALPAAMYLLLNGIIGISKYHTSFYINFEAIFAFLFFFPLFVVGAMMQGAKYLSAWWNIQQVLKKDPTGETLINSVKNDPELAKLDNLKPIIDLPKLIKKYYKKIVKLLK